MKKQNFVIYKTPDGVLYKKYYRTAQTASTFPSHIYSYSKRLNLPERILYRFTNFYNAPQKKTPSKRSLAFPALVLAGSMLLGSYALSQANNYTSANSPNAVISSTITNQNTTINTNQQPSSNEKYEVIKYAPPEADIYLASDGKSYYVSLDSALEIAKYNHEFVASALENYNSSVPEDEKYHFNPDIVHYSIWVGLQERESSRQVYNSDNQKYKGGFKIGEKALAEANKVGSEIFGKQLNLTPEHLDNVALGNLACILYNIQNYEYIYNYFSKKGITTKVTPAQMLDSYLFGIGNITEEMAAGVYKQKEYSKDILYYAKVLAPYADALFEEGLINEDHDDIRSRVINKMNEGYQSEQNQFE